MLIRCPKCGKRCEVDDEPTLGRHLLCPFCSEKFSYAGDAAILSICPQCGSSEELANNKDGVAINCKQCGFLYVAKHCDLSKLDITSQDAVPQELSVTDEPLQDEPPQPPKNEDVEPSEEESGGLIETKCPNCGTVYEIAEKKIGDSEKCDVCGEAFIVEKREKIKIPEEKPVASTGGLRIIGPKKQSALTGGLRIIGPKKQTTAGAEKQSQSQSQVKTAFMAKSGPRVISIKPKKQFCRECGNEINPKAVICPNCGCAVDSVGNKDAKQKDKKPIALGCLPVALFFLSWFFVAIFHNWTSVAVSVALAFVAVMMCVYNRLYKQMDGQTTIGDIFKRLGIGGSSISLLAFTLSFAFLMHSCDQQAKEGDFEASIQARQHQEEIDRNGGWTHFQTCPDCHFDNVYFINKGEDLYGPYGRKFQCKSCGHWMKYKTSIF